MFQLNYNHPFIQLENTIEKLTAPFLKQHGFNYFQYLRCYQDGSFGLLTNNTKLLQLMANVPYDIPLIYSSYTEEHAPLRHYSFLWEEELPSEPVQLVRNEFSINQGFTYVKRTKTYYDMIAFALPSPKINIASFYLNKFSAIRQFIDIFDKQHAHLIKLMNQNAISIPEACRDVNYKKICLPDEKYYLHTPNGFAYITEREYACLALLKKGASYKEIAQQLDLSSRTVETYFARIKVRTGVLSRQALLNLIDSCP